MGKYMLIAVVVVALIACIWGAAWISMRRRYVEFAEGICESIDMILKGESIQDFAMEEDTLPSKVQMKLSRLGEITTAAMKEKEAQKTEVQCIVSDISHQLKTPISNITMYCDTIMQQSLSEDVRAQCMNVLGQQVKKLEFLVQSLFKMSRLENNLITLHPEWNCVNDTIADVVESIKRKAQEKGLEIQVNCENEVVLYYDTKWTTEALLNIVDNSVKYTPEGGRVKIWVEPLEMFTKIIVQDNGTGIAAEHINDVCKRFFREEKASRTEGVGLGLYLSREIMLRQKGYIKIQSEKDKGTEIALYFLNHNYI